MKERWREREREREREKERGSERERESESGSYPRCNLKIGTTIKMKRKNIF